jgi:riboflavin biosynthesis pyrimidine reductase
MSCTVVDAGADAVDVTTALDALGALGHRVVLCEGGPTLLSGLTAADVVDEWNQTIAPVLVGGAMQMMLAAAPAVHPWALDRVLVDGGHVFTRYLRQPRSEAGITSR